MLGRLASTLSNRSRPRGQRELAWRRMLLAGSLAVLALSIAALFWLRPLSFPVVLVIAALVGVAAALNVPCRPSRQDEKIGRKLMAAAMDRPASFEDEVRLAYLVQQVALNATPIEKRNSEGRKLGLPIGAPRELSDLVAAGYGLCFDRSRAIETLLRLHGMEVRHVAAFFKPGKTPLQALFSRIAFSHSLSEVKTKRGWMVVDSSVRFVGLSAAGEVFDMAKLAKLPQVEWDPRNREYPPELRSGFAFVYGLYSRHGRFYPPYVSFPNINWRELSFNFWQLSPLSTAS